MVTVDFHFKNMPALRVISTSWSGPWNERRIQKEFETLTRWAKEHDVNTGRWVFMEPGERKWVAALEAFGRPRGSGRVRVRTLKATRVASVTFDPDVVSPRVVYHGLNDWLRWRRQEHEIRAVGASREIYPGDPWKDPKAWARTEVQFAVRK